MRPQPSAGATTSATSSIDRRMKGCGGSIELVAEVVAPALGWEPDAAAGIRRVA